jgi:hypothetical protein
MKNDFTRIIDLLVDIRQELSKDKKIDSTEIVKSLGKVKEGIDKIKTHKEVIVKNLDDIKILKTKFPKIPKPEVKVYERELPKNQKVYVQNFPNQIPNKTEIEKDDWERPIRIYEEYDKFALEFLFQRDGKNVIIQTNRVKI